MKLISIVFLLFVITSITVSVKNRIRTSSSNNKNKNSIRSNNKLNLFNSNLNTNYSPVALPSSSINKTMCQVFKRKLKNTQKRLSSVRVSKNMVLTKLTKFGQKRQKIVKLSRKRKNIPKIPISKKKIRQLEKEKYLKNKKKKKCQSLKCLMARKKAKNSTGHRIILIRKVYNDFNKGAEKPKFHRSKQFKVKEILKDTGKLMKMKALINVLLNKARRQKRMIKSTCK